MRARRFLLFGMVFLIVSVPAFAQVQTEEITISTYYPAPSGVYKTVRLFPGNEPHACDSGYEGSLYYNSSTRTAMICYYNGTNADYEWISMLEGGGGAGYWSQNAASDIYTSDLSGKVGIGVEAPTKKLVVGNNDTNAFRCNFPGMGVAYNQGTGFWVKDCANDVESMIEAGVYSTVGREVRIGAISPDNLILMAGHGANDAIIAILTDGNVGVGTRTPARTLDVEGDLHVSGDIYYKGGIIPDPSDRRFKKDVKQLNNSLDKIRQMQGVSFEWDREQFTDRDFPEGRQVGLIAQDVEKVFPELVNTDDKGYKSLAYDRLTAVLAEAVKELAVQNQELKAQNQELGARVEKLEALQEKQKQE